MSATFTDQQVSYRRRLESLEWHSISSYQGRQITHTFLLQRRDVEQSLFFKVLTDQLNNHFESLSCLKQRTISEGNAMSPFQHFVCLKLFSLQTCLSFSFFFSICSRCCKGWRQNNYVTAATCQNHIILLVWFPNQHTAFAGFFLLFASNLLHVSRETWNSAKVFVLICLTV